MGEHSLSDVEEIWVRDAAEDCCQIPQREHVSGERVRRATINGRKSYVFLASRWRCGSGMMAPHSMQRTLPALCSSSDTESEINRLWVQEQSGLDEMG